MLPSLPERSPTAHALMLEGLHSGEVIAAPVGLNTGPRLVHTPWLYSSIFCVDKSPCTYIVKITKYLTM